MTITAVLSAFNEEVAIGSKVLHIRQHADHVIVVDDGSIDRTSEIAQLAGAEVIRHPLKKGKDVTLSSGINVAVQNGTKIIVIMDIDGQHDPDMIPEAIDHIKNEGYDMVVGSFRNNSKSHDKKSLILLNKKIPTTQIGFLVFSIEIINKVDPVYLNGSPIKNLVSYAEKNHLKIKYQNFENEPNLNQFDSYNIAVVVPAYNEEQLIEETINGIPKYVKRIYLIDDCSTDRTPEIIKHMTDPRIVSVRNEKNRGVGTAIVTGYKLALEDNMDIVAVMAGDNQMDPEQLPSLLIPIIKGQADYTKGNRLISKDFRQGMSKWRFFGNAILTFITKIGSGYWHTMDPQNGYTAISKKALDAISLDAIYPYYGYCNDLLIKLNALEMKVEDIAMPARYGRERSKIKYSKYILKVAPLILRGFLWRLKTKYILLDFHPLVLFYMASMVLLPIGVLFSIWIFLEKLFHIPVSQNLPLLAMFITLMGLQFLLFAMLFDMQADKSRMV